MKRPGASGRVKLGAGLAFRHPAPDSTGLLVLQKALPLVDKTKVSAIESVQLNERRQHTMFNSEWRPAMEDLDQSETKSDRVP